ncbi:hypothetical protein LCM20_12265 [Halobacillus litoralis]|uniref:hypothetical protein n=1 Tax=Halobacillus litoralis TaxID=45668 RepID=UPI001CD5DCF4|nr:hypothetical protein [Halobacillus litoralis]MCA0971371.1 hypothetical protein [Halobacillus litoralis]
MTNNNQVLASEIYNEITDEMDLESISPDKASIERLLRKKFNYLMKNILLRSEDDYKKRNKNYVKSAEKHLVKYLLKSSLSETSEIGRWFNLRLDLSNSDRTVELYDIISNNLTNLLREGLTDEVTFDEWMSTIKTSIDYNNAKSVVDLKNDLDALRAAAKPLNHEIGLGDIYWSNQEGSRGYGIKNQKISSSSLHDFTLNEIAERVYTESEYYAVLESLLSKFKNHAHYNSYKTILDLAIMKRNYESIVEPEGNSNIDDLADFNSDYSQMHAKIYEYLRNNPETHRKIEVEAETDNLLDFFASKE